MERTDNLLINFIEDKKNFFTAYIVPQVTTTGKIICLDIINMEANTMNNFDVDQIVDQIHEDRWVWIKKDHS